MCSDVHDPELFRREVEASNALFSDSPETEGLTVVYDAFDENAVLFYPVAPMLELGQRIGDSSRVLSTASEIASTFFGREIGTLEQAGLRGNVPDAEIAIGDTGTGFLELARVIKRPEMLTPDARAKSAADFINSAQQLSRELALAIPAAPDKPSTPDEELFPEL